MFAFTLTPVICSVIVSFITSSMIVNLISVVNQCIAIAYNVDEKLGQQQNMDIMPKNLKKMILDYHLESKTHKFSYKQTMSTILLADKVKQ